LIYEFVCDRQHQQIDEAKEQQSTVLLLLLRDDEKRRRDSSINQVIVSLFARARFN